MLGIWVSNKKTDSVWLWKFDLYGRWLQPYSEEKKPATNGVDTNFRLFCGQLARKCLAHTLDCIVMQLRKTNREKGYFLQFDLQLQFDFTYIYYRKHGTDTVFYWKHNTTHLKHLQRHWLLNPERAKVSHSVHKYTSLA